MRRDADIEFMRMAGQSLRKQPPGMSTDLALALAFFAAGSQLAEEIKRLQATGTPEDRAIERERIINSICATKIRDLLELDPGPGGNNGFKFRLRRDAVRKIVEEATWPLEQG